MTEQDKQLLDAIGEHLNRVRDGRLEVVMTQRTGLSAVRAWQRVNALLDEPTAWAAYPMVLGVLSSRRDRGSRSAA